MSVRRRRLMGCKVEGRSRLNIRHEAKKLLSAVGDFANDYALLLEGLIYRGVLDIVSDDDPRLGNAEGLYDPTNRCIYLKDSGYRGIVQGTDHRAKFTFWHEVGHMWLKHDMKFARTSSGGLAEHQVWEDSEWQANQFAAEILMPLDEIRKFGYVNPWIIANEFGVSFEAAAVRYKNLVSYGEI